MPLPALCLAQVLSWLHSRPPESSFLLPRRQRELGLLYMGATERMRLAVHRMMTGGVGGENESRR